ncbi:MAG: type I polyketide synthase, partial [Ktedonobacteraceae bacterium]
MALAGGVSAKLPQCEGYTYQPDGIVSPDGHTRTFDSEANGTIFGSGVGVVVLKRLEDALAAGDTIYAVIKGSALNNDGSAKMSYTAPSVDGQAEVVLLAQGLARVDPETISYVETHGTATPMGDPVEVTALTQAFCSTSVKKQFCALGSVKSNLGHLDTAASMAGLIKTILMLKHHLLVPTLHCQQPTPVIDWAESPFYINTHLKPWPTGDTPRRAGVSAFGFGGTNAHIILEEAPTRQIASRTHSHQLLLLSAHTSTALDAATVQLADCLERQKDLELAHVAFTLQMGRTAFTQRRIVVAQTRQDAVAALRGFDPAHVWSGGNLEEGKCPVAFLFPGQGAQYVDMARDLYEGEGVFRQILERCAQLLEPDLGLNILTILYPNAQQRAWAAELLDQTYITQPALFIIEYALAQQWIAWGIQPQVFLGHSIGEYVVACLAGVMQLEDALQIVSLRGRLIQQQPAGTMLSVSLASEVLTPLLRDYALDLAAINGPEHCVVSGLSSSIESFEAVLATKNIASRRLRTSHAFHSSLMEPIAAILAQTIAKIPLKAPSTPFISNVTGTWITAEEATDPHYWAKQLRSTVQFLAGIQQIQHDSRLALLEVGPGQTLSRLAKRQTGGVSRPIVASLRSAQEPHNDSEDILTALGKLWLAGVSVDWNGFWDQQQPQRVPLPGYPFERRPYWIQGRETFQPQFLQAAGIRKRDDLADWFYIPTWKRADRVQTVRDSRVTARNWLILADKWGIGQKLAAELCAAQHQVVLLYPGSHFTQRTETIFEVHPQAKEDFVRLFTTLVERDLVPHSFVHLWALDEAREGTLNTQQFATAQEKGLYSLLSLFQVYTTVTKGSQFSAFLITANLYDVIGNEILRSEQAPIKAMRLVLGQEYPDTICQHIDIQVPRIDSIDLMSKQLVTEILEPRGEISVALRGNHRWVETFEAQAQEEVPVLRSQGVYLIVGGLGQAGFLIASDLAQGQQARLILIDKKDLAAESQAEQRVQIEAWRGQGAEIQVVQADGTDLPTMERIVAETQERWQAIHGVIFAAGDALPLKGLAEITLADLQAEFTTRVEGLLTLEKVLVSYQLDFCLIISSLVSILGGLEHLAYAAANVFLDAFVLEHNQYSTQRWTSVNWETWNLNGKSQEQSQVG